MQETVDIQLEDLSLGAFLATPSPSKGLIVFVHGSGSSRYSARNNFVAEELNKAGFATLLTDLLTEKEDANYEMRFDIDFLTQRVLLILGWIRKNPRLQSLPIGLFGASTGAAAALKVAAARPKEIKAVVSRGGRVDLARDVLPQVQSPTLFIVGEKDEEVLALNQTSYCLLSSTKHIEIVSGATHLFEEPGALSIVADLAEKWFLTHISFTDFSH
jgi:dienelactone hydrolase